MALILKYLVLNKKKNALNWKHGKVVPIDSFIAFFEKDCRVLYMTDFICGSQKGKQNENT